MWKGRSNRPLSVHQQTSERKVGTVRRSPQGSRHLGTIAALVSAGVLSVGCSSASQLLENAEGLVQAGTQVAEACVVAQAAWAPGVSPEDARIAIDEALGIVLGVVATSPDVPGVAEIEGALTTAQEALAADPTSTSLGASRGTLETACALVSVAG